MTDPLVLLAVVAALAVAALVAALLGGARSARRCEAAEGACREALSRAERAEGDARHGAERLDEARRLHAALEAEHREAHEERGRLAASEAKLLEAVDGLGDRLDEARHERAAIQGKLDEALGEIRRLEGVEKDLAARIEAGAAARADEVALLRGLRQEMTDRFKALADETLRVQGESFGRSNRERIEALLTPVREQVTHFQRELRDAHQGAALDRERLKVEIDQLTRRSEEVSREAVALTRALKGEKQRQGAWGEMILERLLEDSGLEEGAHYRRQHQMRDEDDRAWRPDVVVRMPQERWLVIDAKVSLSAYERAANEEDEEARRAHLRAHTAALRRHVDDLSGRGYHALAQGSVDYVLMFLPIEGALAAALGEQGDLTSYALRKGVGIVTPTTLMLALRTVEHVWAAERRESNAEAIADRAGKLYDKLALFVEAMEEVGRHLAQAQGAHETAMGRLSQGSGNLLGQADKLKKLGARTQKAIGVEFDEEREPPAIEAAE